MKERGHPDRWLRGAYWWYFGGVGSLTPFLALHYRQLGFSGLQIGLLAATLPLGTALLAPLLGALTDATGGHRLALRLALVSAGGIALALTQARDFGASLLLIALLAVAIAPVTSLMDSYGLTIGELTGVPYGQLRVWGSVGYTIAVWTVGWAMGGRVTRAFLLTYGACMLLALLATAGLPPQRRDAAGPRWQGLGDLWRNRPLVTLLLVTFLMTANAGMMYSFLGIHLASLGGSARLLGLAYAVNALSEMPILAFGSRLLARFGSRRLIAVALVVYAARLLLYSLLAAPAWVLPIQLLHGLTYGVFLLGSVTLAHELAGKERAATAQGLLAAMSFGFGTLAGALVGGALLDLLGTVLLFRVAAAGMGVALLVFLLGLRRGAG